MTTEHLTADDEIYEIDLRAIILALWEARKLILLVTLVAAALAFVVNTWFSPRRYEATAYVFIGQPAVQFSKTQTDASFAVSPTIPDLTAVVKLADAPKVAENVLNDPAVVAALGDKRIAFGGTVLAVGRDELSLKVTDRDPQQAALLANVWAAKVTDMVNATYGLSALTKPLDSQVLQSQKDYKQTQAAFEDALSKNRVNILSAQLDSKKAGLVSILGSITRTRQALDDLQFFEQGLNKIAGETPLSLGDALAFTTIRQRTLTITNEGSSIIVQVDSASFSGLTVAKVLESVTQMRTGLQAQLTRLQSNQSDLEQEILQLQTDTENARAQLDEITTKRNQSKKLYADLSLMQQQTATVLAQSAEVARVSVRAVPAKAAVSPNILLNTILVGIAGLILSISGVLVINWWRNK